MLMFDPVIVLPQNLFRIKSVRSFILDIVIVGQVTKKDSTLPHLIGVHEEDMILWDIGLHCDCLDVVVMFNSNNKHVNNTNNIRMQ